MTSLYAVAPTAAAQDPAPSSTHGHCLGITFAPPERPPLVCTVATGETTHVSPVGDAKAALYVGVVELETDDGQRVPIVSAGQESPCDPWDQVHQVDCIVEDDPTPPIPVEISQKGDTESLCLQEAEAKIDYDTDGDWDIETGTLTTCN